MVFQAPRTPSPSAVSDKGRCSGKRVSFLGWGHAALNSLLPWAQEESEAAAPTLGPVSPLLGSSHFFPASDAGPVTQEARASLLALRRGRRAGPLRSRLRPRP